MTATLERPSATLAEHERPAWLVTEEDLEDYRAKPRTTEENSSIYTMALLAGDVPLEKDGEPVRVTPAPARRSVSERSWVKVAIPHAQQSANSEELPKLMRLWFAAVERCDSEGRADFDSGELAKILGCAGRTVRDTLAQGKRGGLFLEKSDARRVHLIGVTNERPSARRLARRRRAEDVARRSRT